MAEDVCRAGILEGKTALVTGGSRGLGAAIAERFVAEGARVVIGARSDVLGRKVAEQIGPACHFVSLDVADPAQWAAAVGRCEELFGELTVLVNNAAAVLYGPSIAETSLDDYIGIVRVNQIGPFLGIKAVADLMERSGGGSIVNIVSGAAMLALANQSAYASSKWALRGLSRIAAKELGARGIRVNAVFPGSIDTPGRAEIPLARTDFSAQPISRIADPAEIAEVVVFLASDRSSYCTGSEILVDGGALP